MQPKLFTAFNRIARFCGMFLSPPPLIPRREGPAAAASLHIVLPGSPSARDGVLASDLGRDCEYGRDVCEKEIDIWRLTPLQSLGLLLYYRRLNPTGRNSYEAYLSAQQAQARHHPRLPCSYGHQGRPCRARSSSCQGPSPAHRLNNKA